MICVLPRSSGMNCCHCCKEDFCGRLRLHKEFSIDKIDPHIREFILLCRANGFRTFACCEGHPDNDDEGLPYVALIHDEGSTVYDTFERLWDFLLNNGYDDFEVAISRDTYYPNCCSIRVGFYDLGIFNPENDFYDS